MYAQDRSRADPRLDHAYMHILGSVCPILGCACAYAYVRMRMCVCVYTVCTRVHRIWAYTVYAHMGIYGIWLYTVYTGYTLYSVYPVYTVCTSVHAHPRISIADPRMCMYADRCMHMHILGSVCPILGCACAHVRMCIYGIYGCTAVYTVYARIPVHSRVQPYIRLYTAMYRCNGDRTKWSIYDIDHLVLSHPNQLESPKHVLQAY